MKTRQTSEVTGAFCAAIASPKISEANAAAAVVVVFAVFAGATRFAERVSWHTRAASQLWSATDFSREACSLATDAGSEALLFADHAGTMQRRAVRIRITTLSETRLANGTQFATTFAIGSARTVEAARTSKMRTERLARGRAELAPFGDFARQGHTLGVRITGFT